VIRLILALCIGSSIALGLFWAMQIMISNNQQGFKKTDNLVMTEFVRLKRETRLQTKERAVPKKPEPKKRPPPPKLSTQKTKISRVTAPDMAMPNLDIPLQNKNFSGSVLSGQKVNLGAVGRAKISTNVIPLVRIPPVYPRRAANRRIQGWVKIEFTITKDGKVKDAKVIDSKPSSIFNRAALKAIRRWKFKPHIIEGEAQEQRAVQTLEFKLS